jgi:hypothetical protein
MSNSDQCCELYSQIDLYYGLERLVQSLKGQLYYADYNANIKMQKLPDHISSHTIDPKDRSVMHSTRIHFGSPSAEHMMRIVSSLYASLEYRAVTCKICAAMLFCCIDDVLGQCATQFSP